MEFWNFSLIKLFLIIICIYNKHKKGLKGKCTLRKKYVKYDINSLKTHLLNIVSVLSI